jgi:hypothetical protein
LLAGFAPLEAISVRITHSAARLRNGDYRRATANQIPANYSEPVHVYFAKEGAKDDLHYEQGQYSVPKSGRLQGALRGEKE